MKIAIGLIGLICLLGPAAAQKSPDPAQDTVRFLRQAWTTVQREGPKAMESARVRWPEEIRSVRWRVADFSRTWVGRAQSLTLSERARMVAELWRIRGSVNLLALLSPESLKEVTGLDIPDFRRLQEQVRGLRMP